MATFVQAIQVLFKALGTGAVTRDEQSRLRDILSVKDFAVGSGAVDDGPAIAAADTAAAGRTLYFPAGTYKISTNTTVTSPMFFEGGATVSVDTAKVFTANGIVVSLFGNPNAGLGTFTYGSTVNLLGNSLGLAIGTVPSGNSDDFIHCQRDVNNSSGINLWNKNTGSAAQSYFHWFTLDGAAIRISCSSLAGGALANIVFETNLAASIIQQSAFPLDIYTANVKQFQITSVPTAVNYWKFSGSAAGSSITVSPDGTDTNVSMILLPKGTGSLFVRTGATPAFQLEVKDTPGATNRVTITGSNAGNPTIGVSGGSLNIANGIGQGGAGMKHARVSTGSIAATTDALVTITWTNAFPDANYTPVVSVLDSTASNASLKIVHVESIIAASITVRVRNDSAGALTGTVLAHAFHD